MESATEHDDFCNKVAQPRLGVNEVASLRLGLIETAVRQHRGIIYRCIIKILKYFPEFYKADVIDDIFQDVCVLLMTKLEKYDPTRGTKLSTFIGMIAMHETYDFLRRQRSKSRHGQHVDMDHLTEIAGTYESPEDAAVGKELEENIFAARGQLPPFLCRAFDLEIIDEVTDAKDLANSMKIDRKTVYSRRAKLREALASALPEVWRGALEKKKAA